MVEDQHLAVDEFRLPPSSGLVLHKGSKVGGALVIEYRPLREHSTNEQVLGEVST